MNLESIVEALECSYQGNPDQITQAQEFLLEMASQPAEYSTILVNIMTNDNIQSMIRVAAAIQFKYLLSNPEIFDHFTIDIIINIYIETIPLVQVQLQSILAQVVDKYLIEDPEQGIESLLSIVENCFNSDSKHILIGIEIIRFIFKSESCKVYPGIGNKENLATKYIIPQFNLLLQLDFSSIQPFFVHCMLITATYLLNFSDLQPLNNWIEIIISILNQEEELTEGIDEDATEFAVAIIELKREFLEPQIVTIIFNSITDRIKRNQMSYKGILCSLRYIHRFLNVDPFVDTFLSQSESNLLLEFVTEILFEFFVLSPNSIQQINEDLFNFLLFRHNFDSSNLYETPISGSISILKEICKKKYFIDEITQFSLFEINQNINIDKNDENNLCKLYGSVHFASILASYFDSSFSETAIQIITSSIEQNQEKNQQLYLFDITMLFLFLSNICIENLELFILCLNNLTDESLPNIIHYFCAISIPNFFEFFDLDEIIPEIESSLDLPVFIKTLLELNSNYPTNQISVSIKSIFQYFVIILEPVSIEVVQGLFSIYYQFTNDENENKNKICSSINKLSSMMKEKERSLEFYSISIEMNIRLLTEVDTSNYYDLLNILNNLITDSINGINQEELISLNDLFYQIPEFLFELIEESLDFPIFLIISEILKILSIYSTNSSASDLINCISQSTSKILHNSIVKYDNLNETEMYELSDLISSINLLSQVLFIVLKDNENLPPFLEIFTQLNKLEFADSFAAIGTLAPIETFSNELNFRICMNSSSPAAFLLCFEYITQNLNEMPQFVIDAQQEIKETIEFKLRQLTKKLKGLNKRNDFLLFDEEDEEEEEADDENDDDININESEEEDFVLLGEIGENNFKSFDTIDDQDIFDYRSIYEFYHS